VIESLAAAEAEGGLALLGVAGGELSHALAGADAVGILLVVELDVGFGAVGELVADEQAAVPALRQGVVAEVVADVAIERMGPMRPLTSMGDRSWGRARRRRAERSGWGCRERVAGRWRC
jgi:hypothetical protein